MEVTFLLAFRIVAVAGCLAPCRLVVLDFETLCLFTGTDGHPDTPQQ